MLIEKIVYLELCESGEKRLVLGRILGEISKQTYHFKINDNDLEFEFPYIHGQTVKLTGTATLLTAIQIEQVERKCVVVSNNESSETYVLTALANTHETD